MLPYTLKTKYKNLTFGTQLEGIKKLEGGKAWKVPKQRLVHT